ncbi:unnamed protein product [Thlaspi arvense]|uniref:Uncharacterized protein n=1 Tax=Thlaspi arvense TaxID=13288 RepID=A0AAU9SJW6_THLAR|nr:unnamed protein product [Thlaspi arvense]
MQRQNPIAKMMEARNSCVQRDSHPKDPRGGYQEGVQSTKRGPIVRPESSGISITNIPPYPGYHQGSLVYTKPPKLNQAGRTVTKSV